MEIYDDSFSKIALTLTATQMAKETMTKEGGIGTELAFNFFCWKYDIPLICIQMTAGLMSKPQAQRFKYCSDLLSILRTHLGVTGITFIAEGYVAEEPQDKELVLAFLDPNSKVKECLAVMHCDETYNSSRPDLCMFSMPYSYGLNKTIKWGSLTAFSSNAVDIVKHYSYPKMLIKVMRSIPNDPQEFLDDNVRSAILDNGFYIQEF